MIHFDDEDVVMGGSLNLVQKRRSQLQGAVGDLGELVIAALNRSVECVRTQDLDLATRIIDADSDINRQRRTLEQECLVTLAAYKPAGGDLRAVGACMELASELERIGDYAADVARIILKNGKTPFPSESVAAIVQLAGDAIGMLERALGTFTTNSDEASIRAAVALEDEVDREEEEFIDQILGRMRMDADFATTGTYLLWIVHNYERVADRATNIAERAIYVAAGHTPDLD